MREWIKQDSCPRKSKCREHAHAQIHADRAQNDHQRDGDHVALRHEADNDSECKSERHLAWRVVRDQSFEEEADRTKEEHVTSP